MILLEAFRAVQAFLCGILYRLALWVLSAGPIPRHICFVMDGNRRHARSHGKRAFEGHTDGFYALHRVRYLLSIEIRYLNLIELYFSRTTNSSSISVSASISVASASTPSR